jgi:hypothetical protein
MFRSPVTVLDKRLRNGMRLTLSYGPCGYTAELDGTVTSRGFYSHVHRDAVDLPGTPHVFEVPLPPGGFADLRTPPGRFGVPIGLTDTEADAVAGAHDTYHLGPGRWALAAVPDAPTRRLGECPHRHRAGTVLRDAQRRPITVVRVHQRHIDADGRSLGLGTDEGDLYTHTVRAATPRETAFLEFEETCQKRVARAIAELDHRFTWGTVPAVGPQDDARPGDDTDASGGQRLHLGGDLPRQGFLVRHTDRLVTVTVGTSVMDPGATWSHPRTPERDEVFDALMLAPACTLI